MNAPIVTDSQREWAAAWVASRVEMAAITGEPIDIAREEALIWAALLAGPRWSQADDVEGDWPGYLRSGSDRVADQWTGEMP